MTLPITLLDGRQVIPPDNLNEEELELFKTNFATNFPFAVPEEETVPEEEIVGTPLSTEPVIDYSTVAPKDRLPESYSEGDDFSEQVSAGFYNTWLSLNESFNGPLSINNIHNLTKMNYN